MEWNIKGHEWAVQLLQQHIVSGQVRHAYLFAGPPGVGRRTLALRFAQAINCTQPPAPGVPCGTCRMCTHIARMQQTDMSIVQAEEAGSTIKVDQVRDLQHSLSLTPYEASYRIAFLLNFQDATESAQNALLKTLEEAPSRVILFVTADAVENLLPTIVSRCEVMRLRPMAMQQLEETLQSGWSLPADEARHLAHLSGGRTGYALRLHQEPALLDQRRQWSEEMLQLLTSNRRQRFTYAAQFASKAKKTIEKPEQRDIFHTWLTLWRDIMLTASGADLPLVNLEHADRILEIASALGWQTASEHTATLENTLGLLERNANRQLLTEVLLLGWPRVTLS
ncbi:MAG: DNA polymerase III subunit [Anaerolineaceae bacterium]|jgi:DNA polymerase-3 subunit delta'|nr:DNA polymerase III subunit [Anaerolineaceae bacterium]